MAVFTNYDDALDFVYDSMNKSEATILPVVYKQSKDRRLWMSYAERGQMYEKTCNFPLGTDFADEVIPA